MTKKPAWLPFADELSRLDDDRLRSVVDFGLLIRGLDRPPREPVFEALERAVDQRSRRS